MAVDLHQRLGDLRRSRDALASWNRNRQAAKVAGACNCRCSLRNLSTYTVFINPQDRRAKGIRLHLVVRPRKNKGPHGGPFSVERGRRRSDAVERGFWRGSGAAGIAGERQNEASKVERFGPMQATTIAALPQARFLNLVLGRATSPGALENGNLEAGARAGRPNAGSSTTCPSPPALRPAPAAREDARGGRLSSAATAG